MEGRLGRIMEHSDFGNPARIRKIALESKSGAHLTQSILLHAQSIVGGTYAGEISPQDEVRARCILDLYNALDGDQKVRVADGTKEVFIDVVGNQFTRDIPNQTA